VSICAAVAASGRMRLVCPLSVATTVAMLQSRTFPPLSLQWSLRVFAAPG